MNFKLLKAFLAICVILSIVNFFEVRVVWPQIQKLEKYEKSKLAKVEIGMSTNEVKAILGRPKAIDGGFPNSTESIVGSLPEQVGQLNSSTWFYYYSTVKVDMDVSLFVVNGFPVSSEEYAEYEKSNEVFWFENKVISPGMAEGYRLLKDPRLKIVPKALSSTYKSTEKNKSFVPVGCIIFDKGTQVVASKKMFFILGNK